jgi:hypothetical protein
MEGDEEGIIFKPGSMTGAKIVVILGWLLLSEPFKGQVKKSFFGMNNGAIINLAAAGILRRGNLAGGEKPIPDQKLRAYEQWVAGKSRTSMIGGIRANRVCWSQGKDLPVSLLGLGQKVGELVG